MKQVILDTNAVRYFYQIECCNGDGVRDKVMKKYYFDKQNYIQFLRTVSSISIPSTTKFELFFQAYRNGDFDLFLKYNDLTHRYKELYGIDICIINPQQQELKFDQKQLAEDLKVGLIQTELYIRPRIRYEVELMQTFFTILIGTISDVIYADLEIDKSYADLFLGEIVCGLMKSRLQDLYNQYYLDKDIRMNLDEVDKKIDQILLDSIRNAFIFMNVEMSKEYPEKAIEHEIVSYDANCTSEYLKVLLQLGKKYTQNDYLDSLNKALNQMTLQKGYVKTQIEYIGYLLQNALNGASTIVHKNDIADYAIITMLNEKVKLKAIEGGTKKEDLKLITFDRKLHEFSKQNNVMYDAQIYDEFLLPIN